MGPGCLLKPKRLWTRIGMFDLRLTGHFEVAQVRVVAPRPPESPYLYRSFALPLSFLSRDRTPTGFDLHVQAGLVADFRIPETGSVEAVPA
jgi:hypothetical protein